MADEKRDFIEVLGERPSSFDLKSNGVKKDPGREYRWVDPKLSDRRKNANGYSLTKTEGRSEIKQEGMILMDRPMELAERSRKYKEQITKSRTQAIRSRLDEEAERLSSKHGRDVHRYFYSDKEDN